jgi:hypothetical protein
MLQLMSEGHLIGARDTEPAGWPSKRRRESMEDESPLIAALDRIEAQLKTLSDRQLPPDVQQAIEDIFNSYGQIAQMREVMAQLVEVIRAHDEKSTREREELRGLLIQLRELARKQVRSQEDLARAIGSGDGAWTGEDRRRAS